MVSKVIPLEDMPVDDYGLRADIIISPESVFNRMNPAQQFEQFYNRAASIVHQRLVDGELGNDNAAVDYILEFLTDIRPIYGEFIREQLATEELRMDFLDEVKDTGIYMVIPPYTNGVGPKHVLFIAEKYDIRETPVSFNTTFADGTTETIRTINPVAIGSKYLMLLGKIPLSMMSSVEMGYVNQFGTPAKPHSKNTKSQHIYGLTPIRYGEDEICMLTMCVGADTVARFVGTTANSPEAINMVGKELLTAKKPSALRRIKMSTKAIIKLNVNIGIYTHMLGVAGYGPAK